MPLDNFLDKIKLAIINVTENQNESEFNSSFDFVENFSTWSLQNQEYFENRSTEWKIFIILLYSLIVIVSFFGNCIVCKIIFCNSAMRSTTNIYIGNLSISDILMTLFNIPLQLTKILCQNWPLGQILCRCSSLFQGVSVNVSSFTMSCIALDRYYALVYPLRPRATMRSILVNIIFIWGMAMILALPYPILANVEEDITYNLVIRCRLIYPNYLIINQYQFRQFLTLIYLFGQYLTPLSITGITYFRICNILWHRENIGVMSEEQKIRRYVAKWKTIKMLVVVLLVFAICWCPLNIYHTYQDFRGVVGHTKHNSYIFLTCHWFAMSSVGYNPFLYCWLNDKFRSYAKSCLRYFLKVLCIQPKINSGSNRRNKVLRKKVSKRPSKASTGSSSIPNTCKTNQLYQNRDYIGCFSYKCAEVCTRPYAPYTHKEQILKNEYSEKPKF